jgi:hypothetical protein
MALRVRVVPQPAGIVEASNQFRRASGHFRLRALRIALQRHVAAEVSAPIATRNKRARHSPHRPPPKFQGTRDILLSLSGEIGTLGVGRNFDP